MFNDNPTRVLLPSPRESGSSVASDVSAEEAVLEKVKSEWEVFGSLFVQFLMQRNKAQGEPKLILDYAVE